MTPTAIGLDLSLTGTGIASSAGWTRVLRPPVNARGHSRLSWIRNEVLASLSASVALVIVEGPSYGSQAGQSGHHERAGLWWMVTHSLWKRDIDYVVVPPQCRAKYATGKGNAGKADVIREVTRRFAWFEGGEDEADAATLASMGARWLGVPMEESLPIANLKAMDSVAWPTAVGDLTPDRRPA